MYVFIEVLQAASSILQWFVSIASCDMYLSIEVLQAASSILQWVVSIACCDMYVTIDVLQAASSILQWVVIIASCDMYLSMVHRCTGNIISIAAMTCVPPATAVTAIQHDSRHSYFLPWTGHKLGCRLRAQRASYRLNTERICDTEWSKQTSEFHLQWMEVTHYLPLQCYYV